MADGKDKDEGELGLLGSGMGVAIVSVRWRKKAMRIVTRYILLGKICLRRSG